MESSMEVPQKTKRRVAVWSTIPLLGIYLDNTVHAPQCAQQHCLHQPRHGDNLNLHRQRSEKDVVHTHNGILLSQEKNELTPSAATSADLAITILSEVSQRERQIPHSSTHVWNLKHDINGLTHETESDLQTEYTCGSQENVGLGRDGLGVWD